MADEIPEQLKGVDPDSTLRDDSHKKESTVELSASDIVAIEPDEASEIDDQPAGIPVGESTQQYDANALQARAKGDAQTLQVSLNEASSASVDEATTQHAVPQELLAKLQPTVERDPPVGLAEDTPVHEAASTQKMSAVGGPRTEKMPAVNSDTTHPMSLADGPDTTAEMKAHVEVDEDGFYTFTIRPDAYGRAVLPKDIIDACAADEDLEVLVKVRTTGDE